MRVCWYCVRKFASTWGGFSAIIFVGWAVVETGRAAGMPAPAVVVAGGLLLAAVDVWLSRRAFWKARVDRG